MLKSLKLLNDHCTTIKCKAKWKKISHAKIFFDTTSADYKKIMEQNKTLCEYMFEKKGNAVA